MKRILILILIAVLFAGKGITQTLDEKNQLIEEMKIVAIRVPVRVYFKGKSVAGLEINDFKIFEGKAERNIEGFSVIKRKIKRTAQIFQKKNILPLPGRLFVLVFKITHFNPQLEEGLDYLFSNIFRAGDEIILFTNYDTKGYLLKDDLNQVKSKIYLLLKNESRKVRFLRERYLIKLKRLVSEVKYRMKSDGSFHQSNVINFLNDYFQIWGEFKRQYLTPDIKNYINFASFLNTVKKEKWVFDFFQMQMFPQLKTTGNLLRDIQLRYASSSDHWSRKIKDQLHELELEFMAPVRFPSEAISELFYNVDTIFHSFFIPSTNQMINQDLDYKTITTQIETSLKEITQKTGGKLILSGKVKESIKEIEELEDILYVLFFTPADPKNVQKVKIEVSNPKYTLAYSSNRKPDYINRYFNKLKEDFSTIKINKVNFADKSLYFEIIGINIKNKKQQGVVWVRLKGIFNKNHECVYDQHKKITTKEGKETFSAKLNFNNLPKGDYTFILEVKDLMTNHNVSRILEISLK